MINFAFLRLGASPTKNIIGQHLSRDAAIQIWAGGQAFSFIGQASTRTRPILATSSDFERPSPIWRAMRPDAGDVDRVSRDLQPFRPLVSTSRAISTSVGRHRPLGASSASVNRAALAEARGPKGYRRARNPLAQHCQAARQRLIQESAHRLSRLPCARPPLIFRACLDSASASCRTVIVTGQGLYRLVPAGTRLANMIIGAAQMREDPNRLASVGSDFGQLWSDVG